MPLTSSIVLSGRLELYMLRRARIHPSQGDQAGMACGGYLVEQFPCRPAVHHLFGLRHVLTDRHVDDVDVVDDRPDGRH